VPARRGSPRSYPGGGWHSGSLHGCKEVKDLLREIRIRAGIQEGSYDYGLSLITDRASAIEAVMHERQIEFAFEQMLDSHNLQFPFRAM